VLSVSEELAAAIFKEEIFLKREVASFSESLVRHVPED
jgi:hypothetical protein